jgi:hypothetical protein
MHVVPQQRQPQINHRHAEAEKCRTADLDPTSPYFQDFGRLGVGGANPIAPPFEKWQRHEQAPDSQDSIFGLFTKSQAQELC